MKVILPVITEDIVAHLLHNVNENNKFTHIYKFIVSEINLITSWFEIKSILGMFAKNKYGISNKCSVIKNLPLNWFKKISKLLITEKYQYKPIQKVKFSKKNKRSNCDCWSS